MSREAYLKMGIIFEEICNDTNGFKGQAIIRFKYSKINIIF